MHPALTMRSDLEDRAGLLARFQTVRSATRALTVNLTPEDMVIQSMPDVSPTKWHLAHTTWFFEEFLLKPLEVDFTPHDPAYGYLFNSYYEAVGARWTRAQRGLLSRPSVAQVMDYRTAVEARVEALVETLSDADWARAAPIIELGVHHEQQHQELVLTDIKHVLSLNPLAPAPLAPVPQMLAPAPQPVEWAHFEGGLTQVGGCAQAFAYDNELPCHTVYLEPFALADRPVVNAEFLAFIEDGGYAQPRWWLSDGRDAVAAGGWDAPLYWRKVEGRWCEFTLHGLEPLNPAAPVCHISYYEADAFAAWAGARLPREAEWEHAARCDTRADTSARFYTPGWRAHPLPVHDPGAGPPAREATSSVPLRRLMGDVWEWTGSAYAPYPGYRAPEGAVGEYNGKFMSGQMVLRGGSCATPPGHVRATYRNFFPPHARWQVSGLRLAKDV